MNCPERNSDKEKAFSLPPPEYLYLVATTQCNLRCEHCYLWDLELPPEPLNDTDFVKVVEDFSSLSPEGRVCITGGEPLLKRERVIKIVAACRSRGLFCVVNTNGTIWDGALLDELCSFGPDRLAVSLDSHISDIHDKVRGVPGTFDKVINFLQKLKAHREATRSKMELVVHTVIFDGNYRELPELVEFVRPLGVDGIQFQLLSPSFAVRNRHDHFFEEQRCQDTGAASKALTELAAKCSDDRFVKTSKSAFEMLCRSLEEPELCPENSCNSGEKNMIVDVKGDVQLCFSMRSLSGGKVLGNVRRKSLDEMWYSEFAAEARVLMRNCRRPCGMLSCHRREGETF